MKLRKLNNNLISGLLYVIKLVLGVTFIYASYHKIADPAGFAKILYGYAIFPNYSINLLAIFIPFIELVAGFSLILGLYSRSALFLINVLLTGFILIIGFNLLRGHQFDCGCFSFTTPDHLTSHFFLLIRDAALLASGMYLWQKTTRAS